MSKGKNNASDQGRGSVSKGIYVEAMNILMGSYYRISSEDEKIILKIANKLKI